MLAVFEAFNHDLTDEFNNFFQVVHSKRTCNNIRERGRSKGAGESSSQNRSSSEGQSSGSDEVWNPRQHQNTEDRSSCPRITNKQNDLRLAGRRRSFRLVCHLIGKRFSSNE